MKNLDQNFADFLRLLNSHGVEYLKNKAASGRMKDLADIEELTKRRRPEA